MKIEPRSVRNEGRLMYMARDHDRGLVTLDPLYEFDVAKEALAAPACWRIRRRRVMNPHPSLRCGRRYRCRLAKLRIDPLPDDWPVPPRAYRKQRVADGQAVAVAGDPKLPDLVDPARDLFAVRTALIQIVVAGTESDARQARQPREVFLHDQNLGTEIDRRADVERISGEDDKIEMGRRAEQPVKLRQRIV